MQAPSVLLQPSSASWHVGPKNDTGSDGHTQLSEYEAGAAEPAAVPVAGITVAWHPPPCRHTGAPSSVQGSRPAAACTTGGCAGGSTATCVLTELLGCEPSARR